jgi:enoyl-CoA hydratase/carnithine racemase
VSSEQVVTVPLPGSPAAIWHVLTAVGPNLTGATRVVVLRRDADFADDVQAEGRGDENGDEPPAAAIEWLGRPDLITIAVISGRVAGAGLDVALACDLRIFADDAQLSASRSIGSIGRLGELMGAPHALAFVITGESISGRQAAASGLANMSVAPEKLDAAVAEMVATVLSTSREVATVAKAVLIGSAADRRRVADELIVGLRLAATES